MYLNERLTPEPPRSIPAMAVLAAATTLDARVGLNKQVPFLAGASELLWVCFWKPWLSYEVRGK